MRKLERASRYALDYIVGPHLPEWWAGVFAVGYGTLLAVMGNGSLSLGLYQGRIADWFGPVTQMFGLLVLLNALVGLHALHERRKILRMASSVFACYAMFWISLFYILVVPVPWQAVWVYATHAVLEGLVYLRIRHNLTDYW